MAAEKAESPVGEAHAEQPADEHHEPQLIDVSAPLFLWTLGTFLVMAIVLKRIAWKPILEGLDKRETFLRESVEKARKVEDELAGIEAKRTEIISDADERAKDIVGRARKAGMEAERVIQDKTREEVGILMENAQREIKAAQDKAAAKLKQESIDTAIHLASTLIQRNLDSELNRELTNKLIDKIRTDEST
jgi:F-type H+-transporting ATPase subunit b